jgi:hypothetical protein
MTTPAERIVESVRPQLDATVRAAALPWWIPLRIALWLAPIVARWLIELLAATHGQQAGAILTRYRQLAGDLLKPEPLAAYDLVRDVCETPLTAMSAPVCQTMIGRPRPAGSPFRG